MVRSRDLYLRWLICIAIVTCAIPAFAQSGTTIPFVTVAEGQTSSIHGSVQLVIRDQMAWQQLWRRHSGSTKAPVIDFKRDMVIAIFGGVFAEPAAVRITRIVRAHDTLIVFYRSGPTRPLPDYAGSPPVVPFHIVRLARSTLPVTFSQIKTAPIAPKP